MKRTLILSASMVLLALCVMLISFGMTEKRAAPVPEPVLLLAEDDTGAFFRQLRLGAQKAVSESGGELITEILRPAELERIIAKWSMRSYAGAVVYIENDQFRLTVLNTMDAMGIPVVLVGCEDSAHGSIFWNEEDLGRAAAELATSAKKVHIAGGSESARHAAMAILGDRAAAREDLDTASPDQAIIALDSASTLSLCREKEAFGWQCALYGTDPGENRVAFLEEGTAQAFLFTSPYASGYQAASNVLTGVWLQQQPMNWYPVWAQNMYDARSVKLVFPLLN